MSPDTPVRDAVRPASVVNAEIRALWARAGGRLTTAAERAVYARLVVEWATAVQAEREAAEAA